MSFPNIPDINPDINIKFEDAINLLLTSIAMEEVSISKLMDAETKKILCVIEDCKHKDSVLQDAITINKSVDDTIKNMIKLQMLLQFKLDNIKEIIPTTTTSTTTSTSSSTTTTCSKTTTHTTTCTTSTCSTTTKKGYSCCLIGKGKGCVPNCCDEFFGYMAALRAFIFCCDIKNRTIRYAVGDDDANLRFYAYGSNVKVQCPHCCVDKLVVYGKGCVKKQIKCDPEISLEADFILTVRYKVRDILEFRMEIQSDFEPELNHDSGFVQVKRAISDLRLGICH